MKTGEIWECKKKPNMKEFNRLLENNLLSSGHIPLTNTPFRIKIIEKIPKNLWTINVTHWVNYLEEVSVATGDTKVKWNTEHIVSQYHKVY